MTPIPTYRTQIQRTDRILKDWILKERLAFNRVPSLTVSDLSAMLPRQAKEQLGKLKPTDAVFRKLSSGFNNVSDVWIELSRFIGIEDFSAEQAIFGTISVFLDKENVRVKLHKATDEPSRENSIEVFCLNEPDYQGRICYEGYRLSIPPSIFAAVIERRLNVYQLYCEDLSDILLIPGVSDKEGLLKALKTDDDFVESGSGSDIEETDEEESPELEAARIEEAARDAHLDELAEARDAERMADIYSGSDEILDV